MTVQAQKLRLVIVLPVPLSVEPDDAFLPQRIAEIQPDMIVVDAESQGRDILEHVVLATRDERRPIVMFSDGSDVSHVRRAIAAGVSAYGWQARHPPTSNP